MFSKSSLTILTAAAAFFGSAAANPLLAGRAVCNADNCARQVTGTASNGQQPLANRVADCRSFLVTTVTPAPSVLTSTVTLSSGQAMPAPNQAKISPATVTPSSIPTDINACGTGSTATARYGSACSCLSGLTRSTATAPTPTTDTTVYITTTAPTCTVSNNVGLFGRCTTCNYIAGCGAYTCDPSYAVHTQVPSLDSCETACNDEFDCYGVTFDTSLNDCVQCQGAVLVPAANQPITLQYARRHSCGGYCLVDDE